MHVKAIVVAGNERKIITTIVNYAKHMLPVVITSSTLYGNFFLHVKLKKERRNMNT